jgi:hypothetical protein
MSTEPEIEPGEDPETHLLPNRERWGRLSRKEKNELRDLVKDWIGPKVEAWRQEVADR